MYDNLTMVSVAYNLLLAKMCKRYLKAPTHFYHKNGKIKDKLSEARGQKEPFSLAAGNIT